VKKTDTSAAYYEVVESEAEVVRLIFDAYTRQGLSIGAIAGLLNQREVPTRTRHSRWERPTIWRMLHNPAYAGHAFYGKTELRPRRRITRRLRQRGPCSRDSSFRERPRQEWIEIPVPALVSETTFALAQEQFEKNKRFSPDVPSNHPCCRGCWSVSVVVMDSTELRRELPSARSTTIAA